MPTSLEEIESQFVVAGRFREIDGPASKDGRYCNKKLCLVATDKDYLVRLLFEIARRADCFYVKYTPASRDGMYLGRIFLVDEHEVGLLWARFKRDEKLLCSVQDDDFTRPFRDV